MRINKKLYRATCNGMSAAFSDIYVIAEDETEASTKALLKVKELGYERVNDYVSKVELVADEKETNKCLLIL